MWRRAVSLPNSFEVRFVAGHVLLLFPACTAILVFAISRATAWWPLLLVKWVLLLVFSGWMSRRLVPRYRAQVERFASEDADFARRIYRWKWTEHGLPIVVAVLLLACIRSVASSDARWFLLVGALGVLFLAGLVLQWVVFGSWLDRELARVGRRS